MPEFLLSWFLEALSPYKSVALLSEKVNAVSLFSPVLQRWIQKRETFSTWKGSESVSRTPKMG